VSASEAAHDRDDPTSTISFADAFAQAII